jgi:hypothetical protein
MAVRGWCPDCDKLQEITPGERQHPTRGSSRWWLLVLHSDGKGGLCPGGGKKI